MISRILLLQDLFLQYYSSVKLLRNSMADLTDDRLIVKKTIL